MNISQSTSDIIKKYFLENYILLSFLFWLSFLAIFNMGLPHLVPSGLGPPIQAFCTAGCLQIINRFLPSQGLEINIPSTRLLVLISSQSSWVQQATIIKHRSSACMNKPSFNINWVWDKYIEIYYTKFREIQGICMGFQSDHQNLQV